MEKPLKTTLANGLRVILLEKHDAPVVSWNLWANVGSVNETDKIAGICHLIEHMIFKGTSKRPVGEIAREVEAAGGDMNAYTSFDETVFYVNLPSKRAEVGLEVLADAASDPTFDEVELQREKEVVVEEINRAEDNPSQMASEDLFRTAYTTHPYRRPIAGTRETVRGISRRTLLDFFRQRYVGPNLILIGVGDLNAEKTIKKVERLFSSIRMAPAVSISIPREPTQREPRFISRKMNIEGRYLDLGFPIPEFLHPDTPALDLLGEILGGGASSRLELQVKEKKGLVSSIGASAFTPRHPGLFMIWGLLKDGALPAPLKGIREEIDRLREKRVLPVELARAKNNLLAARIYEKQTAERLARKIGFFEGLAGDLALEEEYYRKTLEVTDERIQEVARRYLLTERLTLSLCHPRRAKDPHAGGLLHTLGQAAVAKRPRGSGAVHSYRLDGGISLLVRENHTLPIVAIRTASLGGLGIENQKNNGIGHLISLLVTKGTHHRTFQEIAEEGEGMAGHFEAMSGLNLFGVGSLFLAEKIPEGVELFSDLLLNPSFPEEEIQKEKGLTYTAIRNEEDSLSHMAIKNFLAKLYPRHPYGLPLLGTQRTVRSLRREELMRHYQRILHTKNLVIAVSGDVDPQEIRERLSNKLKGRLVSSRLPKSVIPRPPSRPIEVITARKEKFQSHIVWGFLGTTVKSRDRYPLDVLGAVLSGQGGRLFLELRDRQGLAYSVSSLSQEGIAPGYFLIYMGTDPQKSEKALEGIRREIQKITAESVTREELERAKRYIVGNYERDLQKNSTVAFLLASDTILGLGWQELQRYPREIEKVTVGDVLRVAKRYLRPQNSVLSIVRP